MGTLPRKSIRLTNEEVAELREYVEATGEVEASVLKRSAMRGLRELRLDEGILAYLEWRDSAAAADLAGLPRAEFLQALVDRGITILAGPSTLAPELDLLAGRLQDERLAQIATQMVASNHESPLLG